MIKVGIMIGTLSFTNTNTTNYRNFGASVIGNTLSSGPTGYYGFGVSVAGSSLCSGCIQFCTR